MHFESEIRHSENTLRHVAVSSDLTSRSHRKKTIYKIITHHVSREDYVTIVTRGRYGVVIATSGYYRVSIETLGRYSFSWIAFRRSSVALSIISRLLSLSSQA